MLSGKDQDTDGLDDSFDQIDGFGGAGLTPVNTENQDLPDYLDLDSDGDLVVDVVEAYDLNGDGTPDMDSESMGLKLGQDADKDGLDDGFDQNKNKTNPGNRNKSPMDFPIHSLSGNPVWRNVGGQFPVEWLGFEGELQAGGVALTWITATELKSDYFEVQRTYDGKIYESLGKVNAAGNSQSAQTYQYLDNQSQQAAKQMVVYRLKQVDLDGVFEYSKQVELLLEEISSDVRLTAYPNPTQGPLNIKWSLEGVMLVQGKYQVLDMSGRVMKEGPITDNVQEMQLDVSQLSPGNYLVRIADDHLQLSQKFVKQ